MPKISNYPGKNFDTAMSLAETVDKLGGKCSEETLATKLGKTSGGGSFRSDVLASIKHGLLNKDKQNLNVTQLFSEIKLSYSDEEKLSNLRKSFLMPDTYREILERFDGRELPIDILDKILIKEYNVINAISKTVANNIIKGGEKLGLIVDGVVRLNLTQTGEENADQNDQKEDDQNSSKKNQDDTSAATPEVGKITNKRVNFDNIQKDVTININIQLTVPETTNEEVYEKFFAAMKKNLLS